MARYQDKFWYPNGALAVGVAVTVFERNTGALVPIFSDPAMTVVKANPSNTVAGGLYEFYATPGDYWVAANSVCFPTTLSDGMPVAPGVWQATYVHVQSAPASTWVIAHGFGVQPEVDVVDPSGVVALVQVTHVDDDTVSLFFQAGPQTGTAYLRR